MVGGKKTHSVRRRKSGLAEGDPQGRRLVPRQGEPVQLHEHDNRRVDTLHRRNAHLLLRRRGAEGVELPVCDGADRVFHLVVANFDGYVREVEQVRRRVNVVEVLGPLPAEPVQVARREVLVQPLGILASRHRHLLLAACVDADALPEHRHVVQALTGHRRLRSIAVLDQRGRAVVVQDLHAHDVSAGAEQVEQAPARHRTIRGEVRHKDDGRRGRRVRRVREGCGGGGGGACGHDGLRVRGVEDRSGGGVVASACVAAVHLERRRHRRLSYGDQLAAAEVASVHRLPRARGVGLRGELDEPLPQTGLVKGDDAADALRAQRLREEVVEDVGKLLQRRAVLGTVLLDADVDEEDTVVLRVPPLLRGGRRGVQVLAVAQRVHAQPACRRGAAAAAAAVGRPLLLAEGEHEGCGAAAVLAGGRDGDAVESHQGGDGGGRGRERRKAHLLLADGLEGLVVGRLVVGRRGGVGGGVGVRPGVVVHADEERLDVSVGDVAGDVGNVDDAAGWVHVVVVPAARPLEAVERGPGEVLVVAVWVHGVLSSHDGHRHLVLAADSHAHRTPQHRHAVQVLPRHVRLRRRPVLDQRRLRVVVEDLDAHHVAARAEQVEKRREGCFVVGGQVGHEHDLAVRRRPRRRRHRRSSGRERRGGRGVGAAQGKVAGLGVERVDLEGCGDGGLGERDQVPRLQALAVARVLGGRGVLRGGELDERLLQAGLLEEDCAEDGELRLEEAVEVCDDVRVHGAVGPHALVDADVCEEDGGGALGGVLDVVLVAHEDLDRGAVQHGRRPLVVVHEAAARLLVAELDEADVLSTHNDRGAHFTEGAPQTYQICVGTCRWKIAEKRNTRHSFKPTSSPE
eukprot:Rhum_TRINITY_DN14095_c15_g1::Rhum_TRINITY_DN14095_c15_g1_i1::g.68948::m.68948